MAGKFRYNYYTIDIPSDCETEEDKRFDLAIMQAREQARLYVLPCEWRKVWDNGEQVRVCRISRRTS